MKLMHISDLHLGKRLYETSLIDDQAEALRQILAAVDDVKPTAVLVAGDVYDKSVPTAEAVQLFDFFLVELAKRKVQAFIISGNHDSPERIAFGSRIMDDGGIHLSPVYDGNVKPIVLHDEEGAVNVYMLPFVKPMHVRRFFENEEIVSYTDAVRTAIAHMPIDERERNVLVTHQFVTGGERSESEETVGGTDNVDAAVFAPFDYVALGHLHKPQFCLNGSIRYSGTPLKYSFSEANDEKSITVVELGKKGEAVKVDTIELHPVRDMRRLRGSFEELLRAAENTTSGREDYLQITLTDEDDVPNAMARLQTVYKNALELRYDNARTRASCDMSEWTADEHKTAFELFSEFFKAQNNAEMTDRQRAYMERLIAAVEEENE